MTSLKNICVYSSILLFSLTIAAVIILPFAMTIGVVFSEIGKYIVNTFGPYSIYYFVLFKAVILHKHCSFWCLFEYTRGTVQSIATIFLYVAIVTFAKYFGIYPDIRLYSIAIIFSGMFCVCFPSAYEKAVATANKHLERSENDDDGDGETVVVESNNNNHQHSE